MTQEIAGPSLTPLIYKGVTLGSLNAEKDMFRVTFTAHDGTMYRTQHDSPTLEAAQVLLAQVEAATPAGCSWESMQIYDDMGEPQLGQRV